MPAPHRRTSSSETTLRDGLFDVIPFPIYVVDITTYQIASVNMAMRNKTGAKAGDTCHWAIYRQQAPCTFCRIGQLTAARTEGPAATVFEHFNDRDECWYQIHETLVSWFDGRTVKHSIAVDIAGLKEAQNELSEAYALLALKSAELERASETDALTGLFNRRRLDQAFEYEIGRASRYGQPLSLILADIDRFKSVNDTHGHQVGDLVLQEVAEILRQGMRSVDTVGRWGDEEFLIVCPDTDLDGAAALADKLRGTIAGNLRALAPGQTTSSFGVAQYRDGDSMEDLVARADAALYRAKAGGRNRVET